MSTHEHFHITARWARYCVALVCGAGLGLSAQASVILPSGAVGLTPVTGGFQYVDPTLGNSPGTIFQGRTFSAPSAAQVSLAETYGLELGGRNIAVTATRALTVAEVAAGVAGLASGALAVAGAFQAGWAVGDKIADALGLGDPTAGAGVWPDGGGGWKQNAREPAPKQVGDQYWTGNDPASVSSSPEALCKFVQSNYYGWLTGYTWQPAPDGRAICVGINDKNPNDWFSQSRSIIYKGQGESYKPCNSYIDALNPAYSNLAPVMDSDGKCPTGRYQSVSAPVAQAQIEQYLNNKQDGAKVVGVAQGVLERGGSIPVAAPRSLSGPAQAPAGEATTTRTTNPDGSVTETSSTPQTKYRYDGNAVTYNTTVTNITNNTTNTGATTTTTTTTTTPGSAPTVAADPSKNQCETNPQSVGCQEIGTAPSDQIPKGNQTLSYAAEDMGLPAACPADVTLSTRSGGTRVVSYQPTCDVAVKAKPFIVAVAAFSALGICLAALRGM